jgi:hypothetical protein
MRDGGSPPQRLHRDRRYSADRRAGNRQTHHPEASTPMRNAPSLPYNPVSQLRAMPIAGVRTSNRTRPCCRRYALRRRMGSPEGQRIRPTGYLIRSSPPGHGAPGWSGARPCRIPQDARNEGTLRASASCPGGCAAE